MRVIGITGGIGSGKSRVLDYMRENLCAAICETDKAAHKLQEPGERCYEEIRKHFGKSILNADGTIDRKALGNIVFADEEELKVLNGIVHPAVKTYVKEAIKKAEGHKELFVIESALLMEDHYEEICDELWYIYACKDVRRNRLKESRQLSDEKIQQIMRSQATEGSYRKYCHVTIDNSGDFADTVLQIEKAINRR